MLSNFWIAETWGLQQKLVISTLNHTDYRFTVRAGLRQVPDVCLVFFTVFTFMETLLSVEKMFQTLLETFLLLQHVSRDGQAKVLPTY